MIKVSPLTDTAKNEFTRLFSDYYGELDCADYVPRLIDDYIIPDLLAGLIKIDILHDGKDYAGFVIYQLDDIDNEWNYKEGWGDIREIYVAPSSRGRGLGKFLLFTAEMKLKELGADKVYCLPYEKSADFFAACGYKKTDGYNDELDCPVYEKHNLNNHCKRGV